MIFCATHRRLLASALVLGLCAAPSAARKGQKFEKEDFINVLLSPRLAQWLVGPIARIASDEEIQEYLSLADDQAAEEFIAQFWRKRVDPESPWPGRQVRDIFDQRAERADRMFTEGASLGRRTDRGAIYVLFGEPTRSGFVQDAARNGVTVEIWLYDPSRRIGLHGSPPEERYYFSKKDGVMTFTNAPRVLRSTRRR